MNLCHKSAFSSEREARLFTSKARKDGKKRIGWKEPYFCEVCQCVHLKNIMPKKEPICGT